MGVRQVLPGWPGRALEAAIGHSAARLALDKRSASLLLALLLFVLPLSGQVAEPRVYFSLSSHQTYSPGQKPAIQLYASGVASLDFRVYKVKDPVKFFQQLEETRRYGGLAPRLPQAAGFLERFDEWKRGWRWAIRDFVRFQYSEPARARIRDWMLERERKAILERARGPQPTGFAQVPVLNPEQLVSTWRQPVTLRRYSWESSTVPVSLPGKGLYVVEAVHADLRAYTILNVTDLGLLVKTVPGRLLVFAQDRVSSQPVPDVQVLVWVKKKEVARLSTDAQGLAETSVTLDKPEESLLLARRGDDFAVTHLYSFQLFSRPDRFLRGYVYTDRPVYRPGHTVNYKAIVRSEATSVWQLPAARSVDIEVAGPDDNAIHKRKAALNANGTVSGSFNLPAAAALGYYSVRLVMGQSRIYGGFEVEEYKKPEYEVRVTPEPARVLQGQPLRASIEARYFFGEPVANAAVTYVVHTSSYWPPFYEQDEEEFQEAGEGADYYYGEQILEEKGKLDAQGMLTVAIPTNVPERRHDLRYRIEARVTDAAGREISGRGSALVSWGSFFVHIEPEKYMVREGEPAGFQMAARDYDGKFLPVSARVELYEWRWDWKERKPIERIVSSTQAQTSAAGPARIVLAPPFAGTFRARMIAVTPEGREVRDEAHLWVAGQGERMWGEERARVEIVPDKKSYAPGETARVLIVTGVPSSHVLVTTEGKELHSRQVVALSGPSATLDIPIRSEFAPNFFVAAAFLRENTLYQGSKNVKVPAEDKRLKLELQPSKQEYKPAEPASYTLTARDAAGAPVSGAELSLGVVDEAIYSIRPESAPDIFSSFYGRIYSRVGLTSSLTYWFTGEAGRKPMPLALREQLERRRNRLAQIKPERLVQPKVRKAFPDTAYWVADMVTDASGRATARFAYPDALTAWRATARGVTRDTRVGSAIGRTVVRKNLMVRLAVPRFLTEGDEVTISAIVQNYLTKEKMARVSLQAEGVDVLEGSERDVAVPSRGQVKLDWRLRPRPGAQVKLLGKALTDEESDALELSLPVVPFGVKQFIARAGTIEAGAAETAAEIAFPQQISAESRKLEISVAPTVAGALFGALDYLTTFPYGCTEQTMSSFLPSIVVARALKETGIKSDVDEAQLKRKIQEGLERLYDFQHEDGGWGWWQTDDSHPFMTAYVLAGLAQAELAGYKLRHAALENAQKWLNSSFLRETRALPDLRAYLAYALALSGQKDSAKLDAVWDARSELSPYGLALAGLAMDAAGDARAPQAAAALVASVRETDAEAYWQVENDGLMNFRGDTSAEATAHALKLLVRYKPDLPLLPKAAVWLMRNRNAGYYWHSTKQTAMVVYGLTDFLKASGELRPDFSFTVTLNGKQLLSRRFAGADGVAPGSVTLKLDAQDLAAGANRIQIRKSGAGRLYWSVRGEYYSTEERLAQAGNIQLNLLREYFRLVPMTEAGRIVHKLEAFTGTASPGDVLAVRLTVSGGRWSYLMLEDPIPAGAEFIARDDLYELKEKPRWWWYWFTRREFHDHRAVFFQTNFGSGQQQYFYLLKVVNAGRFRVSPARVEPMYQPQYSATSDARIVEVR